MIGIDTNVLVRYLAQDDPEICVPGIMRAIVARIGLPIRRIIKGS